MHIRSAYELLRSIFAALAEITENDVIIKYHRSGGIIMKRFFLIIMLSVFVLSVFGASVDVTLINPLGPTVIPIVPMLSGMVKSSFPINVRLWRNPDEALALMASKNTNFAVLPITSGAIFYTKGIKISLLGVYEWKVFYMVASKNVTFNSWHSLIGKIVYTPNGRGQTVDVLMRYLMTKNGVKPDEDTRILYAPPQEIVALFKAGKIPFAALPEPFVTMAISGGSGRIVFDFQKAWGESMNLIGRIPIAGLFVKKEYMVDHPEITKEVEKTFTRSVTWMNENVEKSLELSTKYLKIPDPILKKSMKRMNFYYVPISKCEKEVKIFLKKMNELYPKGMPELPDKGFYAN